MTAEIVLDVQGLRVRFDDAAVVDGVSFSVGRGECVAIVGESGAGKSLTARALLGLVLGLFFAFVVIQALEGEGITFSLPIGQIVSLMVFAIVVGIVAAIFPARRASRLDVLHAISYE